MKIVVSERAAKWYQDEELTSSGFIRFYPRYGFGGHIPGFALAVSSEKPENIHASTEVNQITFYVDEKDAWYFHNVDLEITWNESLAEPTFQFIQHQEQ